MFSGLVETVGRLRALRRVGSGAELEVAAALAGEPVQPGESIAVNGVCLTVTQCVPAGFAAQLSQETLRRTTLDALRPKEEVNLERSLRLSDRLGGHLVLGHVDTTVPLVAVSRLDATHTLRVAVPAAWASEVAEKGSVTLDGVSLTVSTVGEGWFEVVVIPATWQRTVLGGRRVGDLLNLETDILAKYVRRAMSGARADLATLLGRGVHEAD